MMKKMFIAVAVATLSLFAFSTADAQLRWGIKGGANFSSASFDKEKMVNEQLKGFHLGPTVELQLGSIPLAIEGSLLFSQRGVNFKETGALEIGKGFLKTNYIEIPLKAKLYFTLVPSVRVFLSAGPSFDFFLSHNMQESVKTSLKDFEAKRFGIGLNAGLGVELFKFLQLSAAYKAPLANDYKFKSVKSAAEDYINAKNKGFSLTATVLF